MAIENDPTLTELWTTYEGLLKASIGLGDGFVADGTFTDAEKRMVAQAAEKAINEARYTTTPLTEDGTLSAAERALILAQPGGQALIERLEKLPHKDLTAAELTARITQLGGTVPSNTTINPQETQVPPTPQPAPRVEATQPDTTPRPVPTAQARLEELTASLNPTSQLNTINTAPTEPRRETASNDAPPPPPPPPPAYMLRSDRTSNLQAVMTGTLTDEARMAIDAVANNNGIFEPQDMNALPGLDPAKLAGIAQMVRTGGEAPAPAQHQEARREQANTDAAIVHQNALDRANENAGHVQVNRVNTDMPANTIAPVAPHHAAPRTADPEVLASVNTVERPAAPPTGEPAVDPAGSQATPTPPTPTSEDIAARNDRVMDHNYVLANIHNEHIQERIAMLDGVAGFSISDVYAMQALESRDPETLKALAQTLRENGVVDPQRVAAAPENPNVGGGTTIEGEGIGLRPR